MFEKPMSCSCTPCCYFTYGFGNSWNTHCLQALQCLNVVVIGAAVLQYTRRIIKHDYNGMAVVTNNKWHSPCSARSISIKEICIEKCRAGFWCGATTSRQSGLGLASNASNARLPRAGGMWGKRRSFTVVSDGVIIAVLW
jgi:hypothetical protein